MHTQFIQKTFLFQINGRLGYMPQWIESTESNFVLDGVLHCRSIYKLHHYLSLSIENGNNQKTRYFWSTLDAIQLKAMPEYNGITNGGWRHIERQPQLRFPTFMFRLVYSLPSFQSWPQCFLFPLIIHIIFVTFYIIHIH